jgi:heme/copper-type cytochrome/quinol oxidase subunit 4
MATEAEKQAGPLPTAHARRFVRYVVGFGVAVGVGLAPFLGKIPGLDALISVFPEELRNSLIPFSAILMGIVALAIQFYSGETLPRAFLRKRFRASLIILLIGLATLITLYSFLIVSYPILHGEKRLPIVISFSRTQTCLCPASFSDLRCLQEITPSPVKIEDCWGSGAIQRSRLLLSFCYLLVTGGFGGLVGLLLLQEDAQKKQRRRPRKAAAAPKTPDSTPAQGTS